MASFTDNTSLNNNNNNHSLNNNTIKYSDKSTQTKTECDECVVPQKAVTEELITAETQTDFTNLHSESICCLSSIPYADMTNSPPPPPPVPYRRMNSKRITDNGNENHHERNHTELNTLSVRNLQYSIDTSVGAATQTAIATVTGGISDNGDIQHKFSESLNGEDL